MQKTIGPVVIIAPKPRLRITPARRKELRAKRDAWLREIDPTDLFHLFDTMEGVQFFAKNREGEVMFWCDAVRKAYQITDEADVIGLTNFDVAPADMAQVYAHGDAHIYATGKPVLNHVELCFDNQGMPDWFVVNKIPIHSRSGKIIGVMGYAQTYEGRARLLPPFDAVSKAVNHLRQNYQQDISIRDLARLAGMSERQLERKFKTYFGMGPQRFLIRTRLLAACRRLSETDQSLAEITFACGFSTQSAFAQYFRSCLGMTPSEFRRRQFAGRENQLEGSPKRATG
jgi:AraC-like DNA-binding protein